MRCGGRHDHRGYPQVMGVTQMIFNLIVSLVLVCATGSLICLISDFFISDRRGM